MGTTLDEHTGCHDNKVWWKLPFDVDWVGCRLLLLGSTTLSVMACVLKGPSHDSVGWGFLGLTVFTYPERTPATQYHSPGTMLSIFIKILINSPRASKPSLISFRALNLIRATCVRCSGLTSHEVKIAMQQCDPEVTVVSLPPVTIAQALASGTLLSSVITCPLLALKTPTPLKL